MDQGLAGANLAEKTELLDTEKKQLGLPPKPEGRWSSGKKASGKCGGGGVKSTKKNCRMDVRNWYI